MKYPRMPVEKDRRYKILPDERKEVIKKWKNGKKIISLASEYSVSVLTIRYILYPREKEKALVRVRKRNSRLWRESEEFRIWLRIQTNKNRKYARSVNPQINKFYSSLQKPEYWKRANAKRWQKIKNDPKLRKEYNEKVKKWAHLNREYVNKKALENYHKRKALKT